MSLQIISVIGKGKFGVIYKVKDQNNRELVFKAVPSDKLKYIELDILNRLRSPYLVRCTEPFITQIEDKIGFTQELKEYNLNQLNVRTIPYTQFKRIILSCIYGLMCLHSKNFLHLDISKKNILFDIKKGQYTAYLADFGWAVRCDNPYHGIDSSKVVKYKNTPYEILKQVSKHEKNKHYSDKSDVWSLGIVFLELLGANFNMYEVNDYLRKLETINEDFISGKIKLYNQNKCSKQEELYLKELLVNMLKLNPEERISSKDFNMLQLLANDKTMNKSCVLNKPKELVMIAYISDATRKGIVMIKNRYEHSSEKIKLEEYFLTVQNFLRLMAKTKDNLTDDELYDMIVAAVKVSYNYYDHIYKGDYEIAEKFNSALGYNFYYYATYLEDLIILNHYLLEGNQELLAYYNILDISKVFEYFREIYEYKYINKSNVKIKDFFKLNVPNRRDNEEVNFLTVVDYHDSHNNNHNNNNKKLSNLIIYKNIEQEFRKDIINHIEPKLIDYYRRTSQDLIEQVDMMIDKNIGDEIDQISVVKKLRNINDYLMYDIIEISAINDIKTIGMGDLEYVIVDYENKFSLIYIDFETRVATHYYSDYIPLLKQHYKKKDIDYVNNFEHGVNECCVILELCLIFIIYYNLKKDVLDFNIKCLDKKTLKLILISLLTN